MDLISLKATELCLDLVLVRFYIFLFRELFVGNNYTNEYILENYVVADLFFKKLSIRTVEWQERMTPGQLISSLGGLLGLCAGISLVTVIQAMWFCIWGFFSILLCKLYSNRN